MRRASAATAHAVRAPRAPWACAPRVPCARLRPRPRLRSSTATGAQHAFATPRGNFSERTTVVAQLANCVAIALSSSHAPSRVLATWAHGTNRCIVRIPAHRLSRAASSSHGMTSNIVVALRAHSLRPSSWAHKQLIALPLCRPANAHCQVHRTPRHAVWRFRLFRTSSCWRHKLAPTAREGWRRLMPAR